MQRLRSLGSGIWLCAAVGIGVFGLARFGSVHAADSPQSVAQQGSAASSSAESRPAEERPALRVLVLEGTARERGRTHGRELRAEIAELLVPWKAWIKDTFHQEPDQFIGAFLQNSKFLEAAERWQPDVLEEVRGIAEGAEIDFDTMFAYQLIDELWAMGETVKDTAANHHCSSIGVNRHGDKPTMVAQNLDLPQYMHGHQTLLRIKLPPSDADRDGKPLEILTFTVPGIVAANGINNYGVAVACNTVLQLKPDLTGLPVDFVVRGLLNCRSREEAVTFAQSVRHASGQNYIIGGGDETWCLECSQDVVTRFEPSPGRGYTYHTNHPVANENYRDAYRQRVDAAQASGGIATRSMRFESLERRLNDPAQINEQLIRETLCSKDDPRDSICNPSTYGSLIMVLDARPYLLLAPGAPNSTEFQRFDFE